MTLVLDASALVELALGRPIGADVAERIADEEVELHAPELVVPEVMQAMRRLVRIGRLDAARASAALAEVFSLDIELHGHLPLVASVWHLRDNLSAYDATYVALTLAVEDAVLLTCDERLAGAARRHSDVDVVLPSG